MAEKGRETIQLAAGVHDASSIKYWDAYNGGRILITGGRKVRIEGAGKGKTVIKGRVSVDGREEGLLMERRTVC